MAVSVLGTSPQADNWGWTRDCILKSKVTTIYRVPYYRAGSVLSALETSPLHNTFKTEVHANPISQGRKPGVRKASGSPARRGRAGIQNHAFLTAVSILPLMQQQKRQSFRERGSREWHPRSNAFASQEVYLQPFTQHFLNVCFVLRIAPAQLGSTKILKGIR